MNNRTKNLVYSVCLGLLTCLTSNAWALTLNEAQKLLASDGASEDRFF